MHLFDHPDFDGHEQVVFCADPESGLRAIIAVHDTMLGPSLGGCRMWPYASDAEALRDVLRLSRGMTYKSALAGLPLGGGKSVIIGNPRTDKTEALLRAMGRNVERLGGRYIVAEDSGTGVPDIKTMAQETTHVSGVVEKTTGTGGTRSGDPSPSTAYGVFVGLKAAVRHRLNRTDLEGLTVAIQGVGSVGGHLAHFLRDAGATLWVTDINAEQARRVAESVGATAVAPDAIFDLDVDVFAPCALGAVLNDDTIARLTSPVVAGAANNQLAEERHGQMLSDRGILYAPDYVINAGGVIDVYYERAGYDHERVMRHVESIADTLTEIFARADAERRPTAAVADGMARQKVGRAR
ncbi:Glu/Leu/Phe/Val dehydrogenase dimerization domain-containing protein [Azospirillum canadense]|uniref:Glu/Leu/Phe/Val dehydrogenase dimerization domain-containing protein n=1 Tax=Azospirillum canadense TaxID=403962 RepID=UPI002227013F|nr:Glu/Leu/Phe/Val dehydrogenase dimerization domain-containing protein [Azospirillum canadense]MCW2239893.1 leucine dehydrogenase [Azospirillum canadense]